MPARIWWLATAVVSLVFAVSLATETAGFTTFCGLNTVVAVSLLAVPSVFTASYAVAATYREHSFAMSEVKARGQRTLLDVLGLNMT